MTEMSVDTIKNLIKSEHLVLPESGGTHNNLVLSEYAEEGNWSVTIMGVPEKCCAIRADSSPDFTQFFLNNNSECKRSDFIIIDESSKKVSIVEMKLTSGNSQFNKARKQIKGSLALFEYIKSLNKLFFSINCNDYMVSYYIFVKKDRTRRTTRNPDHDCRDIEKCAIISGDRFHYSRLIG